MLLVHENYSAKVLKYDKIFLMITSTQPNFFIARIHSQTHTNSTLLNLSYVPLALICMSTVDLLSFIDYDFFFCALVSKFDLTLFQFH